MGGGRSDSVVFALCKIRDFIVRETPTRNPSPQGGGEKTRRTNFEALCFSAAFAHLLPLPLCAQTQPSFTITGDAIPKPLTATPGDAAAGRGLVNDRQKGLCTLCHSGPFPQPYLQGDLAPSLAGVGARLSAGQLRLRLVAPEAVNSATLMPSYLRVGGSARVAARFRGQPLMQPQQIEDMIAYLETLRD